MIFQIISYLLIVFTVINAAITIYCLYSPVIYFRDKSNKIVFETNFPKLTFNFKELSAKSANPNCTITLDDFRFTLLGILFSLHIVCLGNLKLKFFYTATNASGDQLNIRNNS
jgi:hypothetical protein